MKKKIIEIIGIIISIIIIFQNIAYATSSKSSLQNQQSDIDNQIKELENEQKEIKANKSETMKSVEDLIYQISDVENEIDDLKSQVKDLQAQIKVTEKSIEQKEEEYNKQKELLDARVIALYKNGENSYLEIFLSSSSLKDFLSKYYYAEALMNADKEFMQKVTDEKKEIEATKAELEKNKSALDDALSQQRIKQNSLERLKNEKQTYVAQLTAEEKENQQEIEKFEEELKRIAEEEAKKNTTNISQKPSASGYIFPVQGLSKSNINNKTYPSYKGHTGVDVNIGVSGKSVVAVKDGTVVISEARISNGKYYSYGEYIVISHGDGTMTLYAHMLANSRKVKVRDKVKQGQVIGTVGSTGNSTGTHLHFEVRVGGSPVNPLPYLP